MPSVTWNDCRVRAGTIQSVGLMNFQLASAHLRFQVTANGPIARPCYRPVNKRAIVPRADDLTCYLLFMFTPTWVDDAGRRLFLKKLNQNSNNNKSRRYNQDTRRQVGSNGNFMKCYEMLWNVMKCNQMKWTMKWNERWINRPTTYTTSPVRNNQWPATLSSSASPVKHLTTSLLIIY